MPERLNKGGVETVVQPEDAQEKTADQQEKISYARYKELSGIINEMDFLNARRRTRETITGSNKDLTEIETIAKVAGIELHNTKKAVDDRVKLYSVLRGDDKPKDVENHHAQMGDVRLFAEVLRMEGDTDSLDKLIDAYHKVGVHCPICLNKKVMLGEECR